MHLLVMNENSISTLVFLLFFCWIKKTTHWSWPASSPFSGKFYPQTHSMFGWMLRDRRCCVHRGLPLIMKVLCLLLLPILVLTDQQFFFSLMSQCGSCFFFFFSQLIDTKFNDLFNWNHWRGRGTGLCWCWWYQMFVSLVWYFIGLTEAIYSLVFRHKRMGEMNPWP